MNLKQSCKTVFIFRFNSLFIFSTNRIHFLLISTAVISDLYLDENSKLIFPVPQNRSNIFFSYSIYLFSKMLKRLSFALSVVGLTGKFLGAIILLPL